MSGASVRISLEDGTSTWIVSVPVPKYVPGQRSRGVVAAAGEAVTVFVGSILRDAEQVGANLAALEEKP